METGTAIAIGVGALVLVFFLTRQQEQRTAAMIAQQPPKPTGPYALSLQDQIAVGASLFNVFKIGSALAS